MKTFINITISLSRNCNGYKFKYNKHDIVFIYFGLVLTFTNSS
jgi:hypothetical protein